MKNEGPKVEPSIVPVTVNRRPPPIAPHLYGSHPHISATAAPVTIQPADNVSYSYPKYPVATTTSNQKRKRQRNELPANIQLVEVSQSEQLYKTPEQQVYAEEMRQKELKRQEDILSVQEQTGGYTDSHKRKHNIQWLMNEARSRQTELEEKHAAQRVRMKEGRKKYGYS